ncbi:sigma-54 dependent transcriptional regulator [Croceicoccus sp. YJ47]|uniref:sigma-54-dependent transcriptional regulator n=1 Tax=Croceicoccus sp. YJ47 TaxID=2798724 RepID=UPI00192512EA|nr:sigma-54 dependent transcriptional regulator [Croceicoccus sp. YJ47]QQN73652.1 sigma-54-dependent Fis family transcriptional regulator [Croceicoccus sp. YJ47]
MADEQNRHLMLVDDNADRTRQISAMAARAGWRTTRIASATAALAWLSQDDIVPPNALLVDDRVAGEETSQLIGDVRSLLPDLPVLLLTEASSSLLAVQAMRAGAVDYLVKPVGSERLLYALESSLQGRRQKDELAPLAEKIGRDLGFDMMIGSAPELRAALARAAKLARGHAPVLVSGEAGTGKELLARAIHSASPRSKQAIHAVHLAGVAPSHMESALYGHEKGAFAGAFERHVGLLEKADGATLFIDDIERLHPTLQARLATTMERGDVKPVGAAHGFRVDVRILAAASHPAPHMRDTRILDDRLCDLLAPNEVSLPPLRERSGDIPPLCRHFLTLIGEQPGLRKLSISDEALALLEGYDWPGNLRQLQAVLFRAVVFCDVETLSPGDFPQLLDIVGDHTPSAAPQAAGITLFGSDGHIRSLQDIESDVIRLAIGHYRGRMSEVARRLGIGRSTLYRKLAELGIDSAT